VAKRSGTKTGTGSKQVKKVNKKKAKGKSKEGRK